METSRNYFTFKSFYTDLIIVAFSLLICNVLTLGVIGVEFGVELGVFMSIAILYFFRAIFIIPWTIIHLLLNVGLFIFEIKWVRHLFDSEFIKKFPLIFLILVFLIVLNKYVFDFITDKLKGKHREKEPLNLL